MFFVLYSSNCDIEIQILVLFQSSTTFLGIGQEPRLKLVNLAAGWGRAGSDQFWMSQDKNVREKNFLEEKLFDLDKSGICFCFAFHIGFCNKNHLAIHEQDCVFPQGKSRSIELSHFVHFTRTELSWAEAELKLATECMAQFSFLGKL